MTDWQWALAGLADGGFLAWQASGSWELALLCTAGPVFLWFILTAIIGPVWQEEGTE